MFVGNFIIGFSRKSLAYPLVSLNIEICAPSANEKFTGQLSTALNLIISKLFIFFLLLARRVFYGKKGIRALFFRHKAINRPKNSKDVPMVLINA